MKASNGRSKALLIVLLAAVFLSCTPNTPNTPTPNTSKTSELVSPSPPVESAKSPQLAELSSETPAPPRQVGPGMLLGADGKPVEETKSLEFAVLDTENGVLTIGCWPSLQPQLANFLSQNRNFFALATLSVEGQNFVKVVPAKPLPDPKVLKATPGITPAPGIAYLNSKGEMKISLSDSAPGEGYVVIGQGQVDLNMVDTWRAAKSPVKILNSSDLRH